MTHENRIRAVQNIVLAGGTCMIPGFKKRLMQEVKHYMQSAPEFEELRTVVPYLMMPESIYAPNLTTWVGASILMSLGQEVDRFLLTADEYQAGGEKIPDRFGAAFLTNEREQNYFNKNWEVNNARNKQIQYTTNSPISAKSLVSRTMSIASKVQ